MYIIICIFLWQKTLYSQSFVSSQNSLYSLHELVRQSSHANDNTTTSIIATRRFLTIFGSLFSAHQLAVALPVPDVRVLEPEVRFSRTHLSSFQEQKRDEVFLLLYLQLQSRKPKLFQLLLFQLIQLLRNVGRGMILRKYRLAANEDKNKNSAALI